MCRFVIRDRAHKQKNWIEQWSISIKDLNIRKWDKEIEQQFGATAGNEIKINLIKTAQCQYWIWIEDPESQNINTRINVISHLKINFVSFQKYLARD